MNPALHLDFVAAPARPLLAWVCLAAGAALLVVAADRYAEAEEQVLQAEQQLSRLQRQHKELLAGSAARSTAKDSRSQGYQREQKLLDEAARGDWKQALTAVEASLGKEVAILALNQEGGGRSLRITAEARNIGDALAFAERLRVNGKFSEVLLGSHDQRNSTGIPVLGFTLRASW